MMRNMPSSTLFAWHHLAVILSLSLGSISYGYDFSIMTFTIGQPAWYRYFGLTTDEGQPDLYAYPNKMTGAALGLFSAGAIFGAIFVGWMCDSHGRKKSLLLAAMINIIGGALQAGSVHIAMFIVARFITGFAAAMFVTVVPIYIAEVAPPSARGLLVGQHGAFFLFGYSLASWVSVGSFYNKSQPQFQWRFALALQCLWPLLLLLLVQKIPESPRWLLTHGQPDEAWQVLRRLHFHPKNQAVLENYAMEEFNQIRSQAGIDFATYGDVTVLDLFKKPHFAKRMLCAAVVMFTSQACGNLVIYSNVAVLIKGLGFDNGLSLILSAAYISWACVCNFANATFLDRVGRVRSMVIGFAAGGVMVTIEAAIIAVYGYSTNHSALSAGVAVLFLYITTFAGFCDTTLYVYCSEIFPTHIRAKGMAWSIMVFFLSTIPFLESSTTGFATIGWKYYMIFVCFSVICSISLYALCPETKGLSLEEINNVFGDEVAVQVTEDSKEKRESLGSGTAEMLVPDPRK